jgi:LacI family transcriptional regulator
MLILKRKRSLIFVEYGINITKQAYIVDLAKERDWNLQCHDHNLGSLFKPDGALIESLPNSALALKLQNIGCPTVRIGNYVHPDDRSLPAVLPDLRAAGYLAAEHYAKRQYKNVAFVGYTAEDPETDLNPLYKGFFEGSHDHNIKCTYHSTEYEGTKKDSLEVRHEKKTKAYLELVKTIAKPIGLLSTIDSAAWEICDTCLNNGINVPEDVAMLSYGNALGTKMTPISLSSIDPGYEKICRQAMDLLQRLMDGARPPETAIFIPPAKIIDRESTDVLASSDRVVNKALRFMWDNLEKDIAVEDVAKVVGVSRSQLNRKLQHEIGRRTIAELRRKRLELACDLLSNSDLTNVEIAKKTGFKTKSYLQRVFQKEIGMTPLEYRKQNLHC